MILTITEIKLRSPLALIRHFVYAFRVINQLSSSNCISYKTSGFWPRQYTMSLWRNKEDMNSFTRSGDHLHSMKNVKQIASEVRVLSFESYELLAWNEARNLLEKNGRLVFPSSSNN